MDYDLSTNWTIVLIVGAVWELIWKGFALWRASHNDQRTWFLALLLINSIGILPILYLLTSQPNAKKTENRDYGETTLSVK